MNGGPFNYWIVVRWTLLDSLPSTLGLAREARPIQNTKLVAQ
jgi:hypothetical protein